MANRQGHIKRASNHFLGAFTYTVPKLDIDLATLTVQRELPKVEHFSGARWLRERESVPTFASDTGRIPVLTRRQRIPEMPAPFASELALHTL